MAKETKKKELPKLAKIAIYVLIGLGIWLFISLLTGITSGITAATIFWINAVFYEKLRAWLQEYLPE